MLVVLGRYIGLCWALGAGSVMDWTMHRESPVGRVQRPGRAGLHNIQPSLFISAADDPSVSQSVFKITEKAPTSAFSWLKAVTTAFTFKTL